MKLFKKSLLGLAAVCMLGVGTSQAGTDLNEIAPFLAFPGVVAAGEKNGHNVETWVTITNASGSDWKVHMAFINGEGSRYGRGSSDECNECNFDIYLTPNDTETMVFTRAFGQTNIVSLDLSVIEACSWQYGFVTAAIEDPITELSASNNVLLGEEVVVDYTSGAAASVSAIPFQGMDGNDGNRIYSFDDSEYGAFPNVVAADFIAPDLRAGAIRKIDASLTLFTMGFVRNFPPVVDCSVTGYDAFENDFSTSFTFGCWTHMELEDIHPEFAYPNLGQLLFNTHGWLKLACRVDEDADGTFDAYGGVHGAISQEARIGGIIRDARECDPSATNCNPRMGATAAWGRLLYQSRTTGDALSLHLVETVNGPGLD